MTCLDPTRRIVFGLASELLVSEALIHDLSNDSAEAFTVIAESFIKAEGLLVKVSEHMKWLNAHVGTTNRTLQQRPKVFDTVGMDCALHVELRMTNKFVIEAFRAKSVIRAMFIGVDARSRLNNFTDDLA